MENGSLAGRIQIPNAPKIPLNNYLLDLVEEKDVKESGLYLDNAGWLVKELWSDILPKKRQGKQVRFEVARALDIYPTSIYGYKNNRKAISISMLYRLLLLWQCYCGKTDSQIENKWCKFYTRNNWTLSTHSKHQKTKLPKEITPKLAYLMGWMVGDGHFEEAHNYVVKISEKSTNQLELVLRPLFKDLFDIRVPIFKTYLGGYAIQVGSKPVYRFLKNVLKLKTGKIPDLIWTFDKENKRHFLMGVFDSEGYINTNSRDRRVTISQADLEFLEKLRRLFADIDIRFSKLTKHTASLGMWYTIQIRAKDELLRFSYKVGSYHVDKNKKLEILVNEIEKNGKC